jgi:Uma2 family endonuclease
MARVPSRHQGPLPAPDARLVMPETRYEIHEGRLEYVAPADEPHAARHATLAALLKAHVAAGYDVAVDMLTRTSETSDFAPDASVFAEARDPETGGRQLEELAFEVVDTSALSQTGVKAARLHERGVRRIFAVDVKRQRALEWSEDLGTWQMLGATDALEDRVLAVPLPVAALVGMASSDDAVARALLARRVPALAEALDHVRAAGRQEGAVAAKREAILAVLAGRDLVVGDAERALILGIDDAARLDRWLGRAGVCASVAELLAVP